MVHMHHWSFILYLKLIKNDKEKPINTINP